MNKMLKLSNYFLLLLWIMSMPLQSMSGRGSQLGASPILDPKVLAAGVGAAALPAFVLPKKDVVNVGKMILLVGTSSEGKSTLAKLLFNVLITDTSLPTQRWANVSLDGISNAFMKASIREKEKRIERAKHPLDIDSVSDETYTLVSYLKRHVTSRSTGIVCDTVVDSVHDLEWFKKQFPEFDITVVLVFAPLIELPGRVAKRNAEHAGDSLEVRDLVQATRVFASIYTTNPEERACHSAPVGSIYPSDPEFVCMSPMMARSFAHAGSTRSDFREGALGRLPRKDPARPFCERETFGVDFDLRMRDLPPKDRKRDSRTPLYSRLCYDVAVDTTQQKTGDSVTNIISAVFPKKP